ncbi:MAG: hypothetical protein ACO3O3_10870 [Ilumatobacteraceae bacterium]|jgi:hypothetical protein
MACTLTLAGRGVGCKDALGGIKRIYVAEWVDGIWEDIASGEVAGSTAAITFYTYDMTRGSGSLNQTITSDLAAGTVFFDQVCSVTFNKAAASDITEISNLVKGRMAVLVEDNNGNWFVMGHQNGVEVSGGTAQTGTAAGDQNGFTLEFSAQDVAPAPFLALTSGAPTDTDITITAAP